MSLSAAARILALREDLELGRFAAVSEELKLLHTTIDPSTPNYPEVYSLVSMERTRTLIHQGLCRTALEVAESSIKNITALGDDATINSWATFRLLRVLKALADILINYRIQEGLWTAELMERSQPPGEDGFSETVVRHRARIPAALFSIDKR